MTYHKTATAEGLSSPVPLSPLRETVRADTTNGPRPELQLQVGRDLTDERTRRLMPTLGDPADSSHAEAMSLLDGCPTGCGDTALPHHVTHVSGDRWICDYRCTCGETWHTGWKVG